MRGLISYVWHGNRLEGVGLYELVDCHTMFAPEAGLVQKAAAKEGFSTLAQAEARKCHDGLGGGSFA